MILELGRFHPGNVERTKRFEDVRYINMITRRKGERNPVSSGRVGSSKK